MTTAVEIVAWWIGTRICGRRGHRWDHYECDRLKRYCSRCGQEEWVMGNRHPGIGTPAYEWKPMRDASPLSRSAVRRALRVAA